MISDAETFKQADKDFTAKHEAKSRLESLVAQVESTLGEVAAKIKRGAKTAVEGELAKALESLEIEDATAEQLSRAELGLKVRSQFFPPFALLPCLPYPFADLRSVLPSFFSEHFKRLCHPCRDNFYLVMLFALPTLLPSAPLLSVRFIE